MAHARMMCGHVTLFWFLMHTFIVNFVNANAAALNTATISSLLLTLMYIGGIILTGVSQCYAIRRSIIIPNSYLVEPPSLNLKV